MLIEYLSYIVTFIVSSGLAVIGITISYQLFQLHKKSVFSILLYQQIFLFSFFVYSIWGNIALREIIGDINLSEMLISRLAFFIPIIGTPFLFVSWFMLLKFGYNLNGYKFNKGFIYSYFIGFISILFALVFVIQNGTIQIPENTDLFIVRIIILLNLIMHIVFLIPFLFKKKSTPLIKETGFELTMALIYLGTTVIYSASMFFFDLFGFISTCISILLLFGISIFIPVRIQLNSKTNNLEHSDNIDFEAFCNFYEISKRESEIILEICTGKSNKAIADRLYITLQTVKDHNHRIYTKTGVKSRVQLSNLVREKTGIESF